MKANATSLLDIFASKLRLEVPLFQRQYVWGKDQQWEPLWEDISRKFNEHLEDRKDGPVHFLGAMVLDQKQVPITHVEKRQVIDGQQRLTTLQIFLAAFRDFCRTNECIDLAEECESFTLNKGMMADKEVDQFKVWPTTGDRPAFANVMLAGSKSELLRRYPQVWQKYARKPDPRPKIVDAYLFFYDSIEEFFRGGETPDEANADPLPERLEECFQALKSALHIVAIDLDPTDDAQVIFETLNARGEPLLPADLLRNFIFLRAARQGEEQEALYEKYWRQFDEPFWREHVRQGRLSRPRSDLFMQHFLASRQCVDIPIKHLYVEYRFWIERKAPFQNVETELATLQRQGADFRRILKPKAGDPIHRLATCLLSFDVSTVYPLLLWLLDQQLPDEEWNEISVVLESYIVRRAVCDYPTKNYNRVFLRLLQYVQRSSAVNASVLLTYLEQLSGESSAWPTDAEFAEAWRTCHAYSRLTNPRMVHVLKRISDSYFSSKTEEFKIETPLTVEHLLPQMWQEKWPLENGERGLTTVEMWKATNDPLVDASRNRNKMLQTFGNLTLLTQPLNSVVSNSPWEAKKPEVMKSSLLPINQSLHSFTSWDEQSIQERGDQMLLRALEIWPRELA